MCVSVDTVVMVLSTVQVFEGVTTIMSAPIIRVLILFL